MVRRCVAAFIVLAGTAMIATGGYADVFHMPSGKSLELVGVGDERNAADTAMMNDGTTGYGSVGYFYRMGKYDVTAAQYCQFLNAVAKTDTYGLYASVMAPGNPAACGIVQSGAAGNYTYAVASGSADFPVNYVSWGNAARFCNWLQNGQPSGSQGPATTESGAYSLNGDTSDLTQETRNSAARYFLPSENEWYKAAYYKGGSTNAGYWAYPTRSDLPPINTLPDTGNHANYHDDYGSGNGTYTDATNFLTPVGSFSASAGPYGSYDQGGDVWEWNEAVVNSSARGERGGAYNSNITLLNSTYRTYGYPTYKNPDVGFRVAGLPLAGDANIDGTVDVTDLNRVLTNYNKTDMSWTSGDFDGNGLVDAADLTKVLTNYNKTAADRAAGMQPVPEPSGLAILAVGAIGLFAFARRPK